MVNSEKIKNWASNLGADLCGIAPVERFSNAPKGFHPTDVYSETKSVIVIACRELESSLYSKSPVPYTFSSDIALQKVFRIMYELICQMENSKTIAIPIPTEPYEYWDAENLTGKGIISLKHAGYNAGLGSFGRNSLLLNRKYGNLIRLGAIISNSELDPDPIDDFEFCTDTCNRCTDECKGDAILNGSVIKKFCRPHSSQKNKKGELLYVCNNCRKVCPYRAEIQ